MSHLEGILFVLGTVFQIAAMVFAASLMGRENVRRPWIPLFAALLLMLVMRVLRVMLTGSVSAFPSDETAIPWATKAAALAGTLAPMGVSLLIFVSLLSIRRLALAERESKAAAARRAIERDAAEEQARASDRKLKLLLESEREARNEIERIGRIKDEFLATLSHELRTPLNAILGWSQLLRQGGLDDDDRQQALETIERNARAQTQIIEDLLDMSRIISGTMRLEVQRVDLAGVLDAAMETVRPSAQAKSIRLSREYESRSAAISVDPARIQQVVWNLLSNAIKFTPRGGNVQVTMRNTAGQIEVGVADDGEGMDPDFLPHIFERFRQQDSSTTRRHAGLGLGLSIARQLVELHGGTITARSGGRGQGASFTVKLPLPVMRDGAERASRDGKGTSANGAADLLSGVRVLVVDDEPDARELIRRVLREYDADVVTAASTEEALIALKQQRPTVLISDIGMPDTDGYALLRSIRTLSAEEGGETPAIALTAFARSEDRTRAMLAGYQVHMSKPFEPEELAATLASLAGRTGRPGVRA